MSQSRIIIAISVTIVLSAIQVHVFAIADTSPYYLNDTQISTALNLARNSTQFQSLVEGYNYTFDGTFE
ncbi:MAG: hypothetical protein WBF38_01845, partial [Nitrosotalea sp.]